MRAGSALCDAGQLHFPPPVLELGVERKGKYEEEKGKGEKEKGRDRERYLCSLESGEWVAITIGGRISSMFWSYIGPCVG